MLKILERIRRRNLQKALRRYEEVLEHNPEDTKTRLKVAELLLRMGDREGAIEHYLTAADFYEADELYPRAVALYKRVLSLDPRTYQAHFALAELYARRGVFTEAKKHLKKLLELYPEDEKARRKLEEVEREEGLRAKKGEEAEDHLWQEAMQELESQLELQVPEDDHRTQYDVALALKGMGLMEKAVELLLKASADPDLAFDAFLMLGICHKEMGEYGKGVEFLKKALDRKGVPKEKLQEAYHQLGLCYQYLGKRTEAEKAFAKARKM